MGSGWRAATSMGSGRRGTHVANVCSETATEDGRRKSRRWASTGTWASLPRWLRLSGAGLARAQIDRGPRLPGDGPGFPFWAEEIPGQGEGAWRGARRRAFTLVYKTLPAVVATPASALALSAPHHVQARPSARGPQRRPCSGPPQPVRTPNRHSIGWASAPLGTPPAAYVHRSRDTWFRVIVPTRSLLTCLLTCISRRPPPRLHAPRPLTISDTTGP